MELNTNTINLIKSELDLFYSPHNYKLELSNRVETWEYDIKKYCESSDIGIISIGQECIYEYNINKILNYIKKYNSKFKLHLGTSSYSKDTTHPYTNVALLHSTSFINDVNFLKSDYVIGEYYSNLAKHIFLYENVSKKTNPYIISSRRYNLSRFKIYNKLNIKNPSGIIRFILQSPQMSALDIKNNGYTKTNFLLNEYDKTYISFILETAVDDNRTLGYFKALTEKSLIGFHTKTLPIILGCKGLNRELLNMGFWTGNELFNIDDNDINAEDRIVELVNKFNNMNINDIKRIYDDNLVNINSNFELLHKLFDLGKEFNKDYTEYNQHITIL